MNNKVTGAVKHHFLAKNKWWVYSVEEGAGGKGTARSQFSSSSVLNMHEVSLTEEKITRNGCKTLSIECQGIQKNDRQGLKKTPQPSEWTFLHLGERSEKCAWRQHKDSEILTYYNNTIALLH